MAFQLKVEGNYVVRIDTITGDRTEYAQSKSVYREEDDQFIVKESIDNGQLPILKADVDSGEWIDENSVAYTQSTIRSFLQENTGNFNSAPGGSGATLSGQYTAILTNPGITPPTANVLFNDLGGEIIWTRSAVGFYIGTLNGAFPTIEKTVINNSADSVSDGAELHAFGATSITGYYAVGWLNANQVYVLTYNTSFAFAEWKDVIGSARLMFDVKVYQ